MVTTNVIQVVKQSVLQTQVRKLVQMAKPIVKSARKAVKAVSAPLFMPANAVAKPVKAKVIKQTFEQKVIDLASQFKEKNCFCSYGTRKVVETLKDSPTIEKESFAQAQLAVDYEASVNKGLIAEGKKAKFVAAPLPWGNWRTGLEGIILEHKGKQYIRVQYTDAMASNTKLVVNWYMNGKKCEYSEVEQYLRASEKVSTKTIDKTRMNKNQRLVNARHPLSLALSNLQEFSIGGKSVKR